MVPLNCTFFSLFLAQYMPCPDALGYLESQYRLLILLYHDIVRRVPLYETNFHLSLCLLKQKFLRLSTGPHIGRMGVQKTSTNWQNANKPMMNDDQSMSSCRHFAMVWIILSLLNVGKGGSKEGTIFFSFGLMQVNLMDSETDSCLLWFFG